MSIYEILINKKNKIPDDWLTSILLVNVKNINKVDCMVESQTLKMFKGLQKECKHQGLYIGIDDAFRSEQEQAYLYNDFCKRYGKDYADTIVAPVGASEHHSGLAIDISISINEGETYLVTAKPQILKYDNLFKKVHKILYKYGFILRYPERKEEITEYGYEPWHIRYVGIEAATSIFKSEITFEEWHQIMF